jgi:hypothetical protein
MPKNRADAQSIRKCARGHGRFSWFTQRGQVFPTDPQVSALRQHFSSVTIGGKAGLTLKIGQETQEIE